MLMYRLSKLLENMRERINRQDDENLYQPRIHSNRIKSLYQLRLVTGIPLTVLLDMAIQRFLEEQEKKIGEQIMVYGKRDTN
jgi:hypothetical protein